MKEAATLYDLSGLTGVQFWPQASGSQLVVEHPDGQRGRVTDAVYSDAVRMMSRGASASELRTFLYDNTVF